MNYLTEFDLSVDIGLIVHMFCAKYIYIYIYIYIYKQN